MIHFAKEQAMFKHL